MKKLIAKLTALDGDKWHAVTMRMAWVYRTGGLQTPPPTVLAGTAGKVPTEEQWSLIRRTVNAARKAAASAERRYEERDRKALRKIYMRKYMQSYRVGRKVANG